MRSLHHTQLVSIMEAVEYSTLELGEDWEVLNSADELLEIVVTYYILFYKDCLNYRNTKAATPVSYRI